MVTFGKWIKAETHAELSAGESRTLRQVPVREPHYRKCTKMETNTIFIGIGGQYGEDPYTIHYTIHWFQDIQVLNSTGVYGELVSLVLRFQPSWWRRCQPSQKEKKARLVSQVHFTDCAQISTLTYDVCEWKSCNKHLFFSIKKTWSPTVQHWGWLILLPPKSWRRWSDFVSHNMSDNWYLRVSVDP